jgi:N-methylhydantoinase A/oxoprolinase/acetone carboxylase beta subunit
MGNEIFKETNLKGYDPRDFTLFAYGGGGPAHACGYGSLVGVERIMTFPFASVFSAFGIANTDFRASYDGAAAVKLFDGNTNQWLEDFEVFNNSVASLQKEALRDANDLGVKDVLWSVELYMRYGHQPHLTRVQSPRIFLDSAEDVTAVYDAFEEEYSRVCTAGRRPTWLVASRFPGITLWSTIPTSKVELPVRSWSQASSCLRYPPTFWKCGKRMDRDPPCTKTV